ncbi:hypothetical protein HaLaN_24227 [Haematococcus lacustris]|uniref:Uncharacterized protein n=1 Tax=Haematococcus lacustris TaxID=44745 RepID=A0A6A0A144_HAELA|nr:hypothetical protein HaLaN_24227 [Haematococcus lacustris]
MHDKGGVSHDVKHTITLMGHDRHDGWDSMRHARVWREGHRPSPQMIQCDGCVGLIKVRVRVKVGCQRLADLQGATQGVGLAGAARRGGRGGQPQCSGLQRLSALPRRRRRSAGRGSAGPGGGQQIKEEPDFPRPTQRRLGLIVVAVGAAVTTAIKEVGEPLGWPVKGGRPPTGAWSSLVRPALDVELYQG